MAQAEKLFGHAIASSDGIVIGRIQKLASGRHPIPERKLEPADVPAELQRLNDALEDALKELDEEHEHLADMKSQEPLMILKAHRMMLEDPELIDKARQLIEENLINAEWALRQQLDTIEAIFDDIEDPYLREKKSDVEQAGVRILRHLVGHSLDIDLPGSNESQILVCREFSPQDVVSLWRLGIAGIIAEQGAMNAHSIIVARGIGMPALVGSEDIVNRSRDGDTIILDATLGKWIINPTKADQKHYQDFMAALEVIRNDLSVYADRPSVSHNNHAMPIMANLEFEEELAQARQVGAEGIGLFRTEFAFLQSKYTPDADSLYRQYSHVVRGMQGLPITFRLLDIGGDKPALFDHLSGYQYGGENPAMGLRGIRLLLRQPELLKLQLGALVRVADEAAIQILVPMVSTAEEMEQVREIIESCKKELGVRQDIPVGAMIEVPAAVIIAKELAAVSNFFSIGTNDLIQYTLAADRGDEDVCAIYKSIHPAIRQLIQMTVNAAQDQGIPVSVCGELAADSEWTQTFLDMGMDSLSMSLNSILMIRKHLSKLEYQPTE